jgi:hypothetical protein
MSQQAKAVASAMKGGLPSTNLVRHDNKTGTPAKSQAAAGQNKVIVQQNTSAGSGSTVTAPAEQSVLSSAMKALRWTFDHKTRRYFCRRSDGRISWSKPARPMEQSGSL